MAEPKGRFVIRAAWLLYASLSVFACSGYPTPTQGSETSPLASCGQDGHILETAAPGDTYTATDPDIQSAVVSNGVVTVTLAGDSWSFLVESRTSTSVPLVIQLRDAEHRTLCPALN